MPQRFRGAALLEALTAYADMMEGRVLRAFNKSIKTLLNESDLPLMMRQLQRGQITPDELPDRIDKLTLDGDEIKRLVRQTTAGSGTVTAKEVGLERVWDVTQPAAIEVARDLANSTFVNISRTTMKTLADTVADALATGMGRDELVRIIKRNVGLLPSSAVAVQRYEDGLIDRGTSTTRAKKLANDYANRMLSYRAKMIARTEVARARSYGQQLFWEQSAEKMLLPVDSQRVWMTADDERVCDICGPMDQSRAGLHEPWMTPAGLVNVPTDSHPQCRCAMGMFFPGFTDESILRAPSTKYVSKFNPYHDELGRFTTAGAAFTIAGDAGALPGLKVPPSMRGGAGHLAALASAEGGFTYNQKRGEFRRSGLAVAAYPDAERAFTLEQWATEGPAAVVGYIKEMDAKLGLPNVHVGAWKGERDGQVFIFLDLSVVRNTHKGAASLARKGKQDAYYDLASGGDYVRRDDNLYYASDGSDKIGKRLTKQGNVYFITPRDARDPQALLQFVNAVAASPPVVMSEVSKFNPYHDELGRFTTAGRSASGSAPAGPKRGQPYRDERVGAGGGMTGEPNPVTGDIMSTTEFGDTMETLFHKRAPRMVGFKNMFGRGLTQFRKGVRTGAVDYTTEKYAVEVKSINVQASEIRLVMARQAVVEKIRAAKELGLKGGIVSQVVDFDRGEVRVYGWPKGFYNPSSKVSADSVNIKFSPQHSFDLLGTYTFTRKQWYEAQQATFRRNRGKVVGTWGDYEPPDTMSKMDDLTWRSHLSKNREEQGPNVEVRPGDTVIQLVEHNGEMVPIIWTASNEIAKFNPYHDERGRFTTADNAATISGGPLAANRELTITLIERGLGRSMTDDEMEMIRSAEARKLEFARHVDLEQGDPAVYAPASYSPDPSIKVIVDKHMRGIVKETGAKRVREALTTEEQEAVRESSERAGFQFGYYKVEVVEDAIPPGQKTYRQILTTDTERMVTAFVEGQHNQWATSAGDGDPDALAVQVAAAEMQGWTDQQIDERVFRMSDRPALAHERGDRGDSNDARMAREIAHTVLTTRLGDSTTEFVYDRSTLLHDPMTMHLAIKAAAEEDAFDGGWSKNVKVKVAIPAQTLIRAAILGDGIKAVLAAEQRLAQQTVKDAVGGSDTITLFRGVMDNAGKRVLDNAADVIRSESAPLSSWSVSYGEAEQFGFDRGGVVLRADVPVSSIVGTSGTGFGCLVEGEVIVNGSSFDSTVVSGQDVGSYANLQKAATIINLDEEDINQDWTKQVDDTYAALGLPSPISKFNPYHDELGRFSTAEGDAYGAATDRFTPAGSNLKDSPLQEKGAHITQLFPGHYRVEYGDIDEEIEDPYGNEFAEEGSTHWGTWEGNWQMRHASAALMGLPSPQASGSEYTDRNMNEAFATGNAELLDEDGLHEAARTIHMTNKVMKEIYGAYEDAPLLHRGLTDVDPDSHLLTAPIGSTYVTPLTAYSSDPAVAVSFAADNQSSDHPEVMVVVAPGSKAVHGGEYSFGEDVDHYTTATGWVKGDYAPVEHVSQGRYRIVDRIESSMLAQSTNRGGLRQAIHESEQVRPVTTVIVEQVSTYAHGYGWSDNSNEADALPPSMREGLASDVRQLDLWEDEGD